MRRLFPTTVILLSFLVFSLEKTVFAGPTLPVIQGKPTLAMVNGEPLALDDLRRQLGAMHEGVAEGATAPRMDPTDLLDRMINLQLVLQEARVIGLDELPEVNNAIDMYGKDKRRAMLFGVHVRNIRTPDGKEVDRRYRKETKEVKLVSVLVEKEEDAKKLDAEVKAGGDFEAIAKRMIEAGEARGSAEGEYLKHKDLLPEVATVLYKMKKGEVSPLFQIGKKYSMVKLLGIRFPKDPEIRRKVEEEVLQTKRTAALKKYVEDLKKKYVKANENLLKSLDYDAPGPGIESLLKDPRIVVEITGEDPVTVMELSEGIQKKFYHGTETAAQKGRINRMKSQVLEEILVKRVTEREAKRLKIDRTPAYRDDVEEYRRNILFALFVQKVIEPGITVDEADLKEYREKHIGEYTTPGMMRIDSIAFTGRNAAEKSIEGLKGGADFQWTRANAEGQVDPAKRKDILVFGDGPILAEELPEGVQKAVANGVAGEYRLYSPSGGPHYVLRIREVIPPAPQSYESIRGEIARKVFDIKRKGALEDYMAKLRSAADVKMFAEGKALNQIVREHGK